MQKILVLFLASLFAGFSASAQFGGILKKAKQKTQERIDQRIDKSIDKTLDKAEGKETTTPATNTAATSSPSNVAGDKDSEANTPSNKFTQFSKYDFVPGDSILYAEDFAQDALGELPLNWNTSGTGEVSTLESISGNWLRLHKNFRYLSANLKRWPENFTLEFDMVLQLKNNGWSYPNLRVSMFDSGEEPASSNEFLKRIDQLTAVTANINPAEMRNTSVRLNSFRESRTHYASDARMYDALEKEYFKVVHVAIQVQKERYRMWINSDKVFDAPKAVPANASFNQLMFEVGSTNYPEDKYAVFVSNIKVATGRPDTRHKLIDEGRFATTGILFDFQSAVIRPESYAVVKEIAAVLKEHAQVRVKVVGHTSSDGDDKANLELSRKRAAAVKQLLITEFGIDASRIEDEGKGEAEPVADNNTRDGKIANRRVEFVKL
ncbi:MAG: OmpA family protein [Chitinophagaceae bacterium]